MYSRFSGKQERVSRLPEHYSGCAFTQEHLPHRETAPKAPMPALFEIAKPSPPPTDAVTEREEGAHVEESPPPAEEVAPSPIKATPTGLLGGLGSAFPFGHGIGFEELLILGLIILLSKDAGDSDTVLWLGLLLFCG